MMGHDEIYLKTLYLKEELYGILGSVISMIHLQKRIFGEETAGECRGRSRKQCGFTQGLHHLISEESRRIAFTPLNRGGNSK